VVIGLLVAGILAGIAGYASSGRVAPDRWAPGVLHLLFLTGAPLAAVVATHTRFDLTLLGGLVAGWVALLFSFAVVMFATRRQPGPKRAETLLAVCWPNTGFIGLPAAVVVFGWDSLPLAIAFAQLCSTPFTQILLPSASAALASERSAPRERAVAVLRNPYLPALTIGYGLALLGVGAPAFILAPASWAILLTTLPAFAAVGAMLGAHGVQMEAEAARLVAARLVIASVPLLLLRAVLPVPGVFVLAAAMSTGMSSMGVAATYRLPTARLASTLAISTAIVLAVLTVVPLVRL
jgi:predicted permease